MVANKNLVEVTSLYLNGLGDGNLQRREAWLLERQRKAGMTVVAAHINWRSKEAFFHLRDRITQQAEELLDPMESEDIFLLNATSAGVCLSLAVIQQLDDPRVRIIGHSGRVRAGKLARWDPRTMERCAHLGTDEESMSFYNGVRECETNVIPNLTSDQMDRILLTTPLAGIDEIVPGNTMPIEGVRNIVMPIVSHVGAIGLGLYQVPRLVHQIS